jgi:hypothetical protein
MIIFKIKLIVSKLTRHKNVTLFVVFMFWCTEVMISIPGVVVHYYRTNNPLFDWLQFGITQVPFSQKEYSFDVYAFMKLTRRFLLAVFNIYLCIKYVNTLEKED